MGKSKLSEKQKVLLIYLAFFILVLVRHALMGIVSDDRVNIQNHAGMSFAEIFRWRYGFNGKIFTDMLAEFVYFHVPFWLWKLLDSLVWLGLAKLVAMIFTEEKVDQVLMVCLVVALYPWQILSSSGYIATTANYIYPMVGLLLAVYPCVRLFRSGNGAHWYSYLFALSGMVYAANQDQFGIVMVGGFFLAAVVSMIVSIMSHKKNGGSEAGDLCSICGSRLWKLHIWGFFLLSLVIYGLEFLLPGHLNRMQSTEEMERYLPQFADWSLVKKVYQGYSTTVGSAFFERMDVMILLMLLLALAAWAAKETSRKEKIIGSVPLAIHILIKAVGCDHFTVTYDYSYGMPQIGDFSAKSGKMYMLAFLLSVLLIASLILAVWNCRVGLSGRLCMLGLLFLAAGSRIMMGLSATLYASGRRTFTFFLFALAFCCLILYNEIRKMAPSYLKWMALLAALVLFIA